MENLALRQQLTIQQRTIKRPKLKNKDRIFWSWLSQIWPDWKSNLIIVKPETVIKWHRQGFKLYWRWKSQSHKVGRPKISKEIRDLIRQMSRENPTWGAPRIQSELKQWIPHQVSAFSGTTIQITCDSVLRLNYYDGGFSEKVHVFLPDKFRILPYRQILRHIVIVFIQD